MLTIVYVSCTHYVKFEGAKKYFVIEKQIQDGVQEHIPYYMGAKSWNFSGAIDGIFVIRE